MPVRLEQLDELLAVPLPRRVEGAAEQQQPAAGMPGDEPAPRREQLGVTLDAAAAVDEPLGPVHVRDHDHEEVVRPDLERGADLLSFGGVVVRPEPLGVHSVRDRRRARRRAAQRPVAPRGELAAADGHRVEPGEQPLRGPDDRRVQVERTGHHVHPRDAEPCGGQPDRHGRGVQVVEQHVRPQRAQLAAQAEQPGHGGRPGRERHRAVHDGHAAVGERAPDRSVPRRQHGDHLVPPRAQRLDLRHRPRPAAAGLEHQHHPAHSPASPESTLLVALSSERSARSRTCGRVASRSPGVTVPEVDRRWLTGTPRARRPAGAGCRAPGPRSARPGRSRRRRGR